MSGTHRGHVLDHLWAIVPDYATDSQIRETTGIGSHLQVYLLTQELMYSRLIRGEQRGREWIFWADESADVQLASPGRASCRDLAPVVDERLTPRAFEDLARAVMSERFGVPLAPGQMPACTRNGTWCPS